MVMRAHLPRVVDICQREASVLARLGPDAEVHVTEPGESERCINQACHPHRHCSWLTGHEICCCTLLSPREENTQWCGSAPIKMYNTIISPGPVNMPWVTLPPLAKALTCFRMKAYWPIWTANHWVSRLRLPQSSQKTTIKKTCAAEKWASEHESTHRREPAPWLVASVGRADGRAPSKYCRTHGRRAL